MPFKCFLTPPPPLSPSPGSHSLVTPHPHAQPISGQDLFCLAPYLNLQVHKPPPPPPPPPSQPLSPHLCTACAYFWRISRWKVPASAPAGQSSSSPVLSFSIHDLMSHLSHPDRPLSHSSPHVHQHHSCCAHCCWSMSFILLAGSTRQTSACRNVCLWDADGTATECKPAQSMALMLSELCHSDLTSGLADLPKQMV